MLLTWGTIPLNTVVFTSFQQNNLLHNLNNAIKRALTHYSHLISISIKISKGPNNAFSIKRG